MTGQRGVDQTTPLSPLAPPTALANLSPTSSAASPLARVDSSILAEFDPYASEAPVVAAASRDSNVETRTSRSSDQLNLAELSLNEPFEEKSGDGASQPEPTEGKPLIPDLVHSSPPQSSQPLRAESSASQAQAESTRNSTRLPPQRKDTNASEDTQTAAIPFDFQGFLVQIRSKPAESIQKYLKR